MNYYGRSARPLRVPLAFRSWNHADGTLTSILPAFASHWYRERTARRQKTEARRPIGV